MTNKTFKALSILLHYPNGESLATLPEIQAVLETDTRLSGTVKKNMAALIETFSTEELMLLQEQYVDLFDRTRALSLHIFEHVHGESRARGQAMVDLQEHYQHYGFQLSAAELPDFLPLILEFFAEIEFAEAQELLRQFLTVIAVIEARLKAGNSTYAAIFSALLELSDSRVELPPIQAVTMPSAEQLDEAWEESAVRFGGQACDSCGTERSSVCTS